LTLMLMLSPVSCFHLLVEVSAWVFFGGGGEGASVTESKPRRVGGGNETNPTHPRWPHNC